MICIKKLIYIIIILGVNQTFGQKILTKKEALEIALENNYGVKVANNNLEIAKNNTSIYNSGYLPTLSVNSGANYSSDNQDIERQNGEEIKINAAETKSVNAALNLNYTLFDGLGRKYNYKQLKETYNLTELQARETIENMYLQLFNVYFEIARLYENTNNLKKALNVSKQRLDRAKYQYEYGQTTKLELLNAEVDVNNDSISYISTKQLFENAKRDLSIILGTNTLNDYEVETEVDFIVLKPYKELLAQAYENNVTLKQNEKNIAINEFNLKINKSSYLPKVNLNSSYGLNKSINPPTSFLAVANSTGLRAGVSLSWNLFDGGLTKTRLANSKIALENQKILQQQQMETLENFLKNTYESYNNALFVLEAQTKNVGTNKNNFERTQERYKLGQVTSIEFRQAQINLLNAQTALNNATFDAKLVELQLLKLSGEILNVSF